MGWIDKFYENSWLRIMRHNSTTGHAEVNGTALSPTYSVADWTALQALSMTSADNNLIALVETIGNNSSGTLFRYVHSITRWVNLHPILFYSGVYGTIAAPTVTRAVGVTAAGAFAFPTVPTIPAGMLRADSQIEINSQHVRTGATGAGSYVVSMYLGTNGSEASDSDIDAVTWSNTTAHFINMNPIITFPTTTSLVSTYSTAKGMGSSSANTMKDRSTAINTAADMKVTIAMSAKDTADLFAVLGLNIWINKI